MMIAAAAAAIAYRATSLSFRLRMAGRINSATRFITLMSGLMAGPAVSLNGSPTVSPMTTALWISDPLPPRLPSSMYFFALSHAPPELDKKFAMSAPTMIVAARNPPSANSPRAKPTTTGINTASSAGVMSSRSAAAVQISITGP